MDESTSYSTSAQPNFIELTADIVSAYVANNPVPVPGLPTLLSGVHAALTGLGQTTAPTEPEFKRATPAQIRKSITPDALISFIDGKPYKTLRRHLGTHGLTFQEYRERYGLPRDYPATAPSYSAMRAEFARNLGLGTQHRKTAPKTATVVETIAEAPKTRGRKKVAEPAAQPAERPTRARKAKKASAAAA
jgi:predicted transcriptional regulator